MGLSNWLCLPPPTHPLAPPPICEPLQPTNGQLTIPLLKKNGHFAHTGTLAHTHSFTRNAHTCTQEDTDTMHAHTHGKVCS